MTAPVRQRTTERPSLWRNREFVALWSGQVVSTLGAQISGTAMPLLVLATTESPSDAGIVGAAGTLPFLVAHLPAGPLVDRWNRRWILLISELVAGLALATVPVAMWWGTLSIAHLAAVSFLQGLCFVFFGLAERAALPKIVPAALLPTAVAHNEARSRGAALAGPPLGGLLFGIGRAIPFLADALSYVIASIGLLLIRSDLQNRTTTPPEPLWQATTAGLRWIWRHPLIRAAILLIAVSNLVFHALVLIIVVLAQQHGATSTTIGMMLGIYSGGGFIGALAASRFHHRFTPRTVIIGVNWIWAALLPLFALASSPLLIGVVGAACAFIGPLWNVVIITYTTVLVPNELLGRVTSAAMTLSWGVMPPASLGAGYLLTALGPTSSVLVLTMVMLVTAVIATASPAVRHAPPLPSPDESA
ncbi:MFS transporter [Streptomyces sporangiiformans]|uniref:MFS transporter n=1 Tax=Streptomyces sporangiiformans TaxID=2315329 RepID=A0A505DFY7_9ACTN|nr:MFS transporter [Streptomyces sporangiiformans]TPQ18016.1 MFS transporter [Streptomyces sporangiiformans]